eukprot:3398981-Lingulodinium_polyedra.AAC.1
MCIRDSPRATLALLTGRAKSEPLTSEIRSRGSTPNAGAATDWPIQAGASNKMVSSIAPVFATACRNLG